MDMEQVLSESWAVKSGNITSVTTGLKSYAVASAGASGVLLHFVGPMDKVTRLIVDYGPTYVRVGEGTKVVARVASGTTGATVTVSAAMVANFSVGDSVILGASRVAVNTASAVITKISGINIILGNYTGAVNTYTTTGSAVLFLSDRTLLSSTRWVNGVPNTAVKGVEVFSMHKHKPSVAPVASSIFGIINVTTSGISTSIDSNSMRNSLIDIVMLYNDYSNNLVFSRYVQDAALTSIGFNYTADGNATQTYDFQTGKSIDYAGYINRRSMVASGASLTFGLTKCSGIFRGSETCDPIVANTTLNENTFGKYFAKVQTLTTGNVPKVWTEVASGTVTLASDQYKYNGTLLTFGATIASGTRIEVTYLCDAAYVNAQDAYQFDVNAFNHTGYPEVVTGKYQPLTINSSNFTNRIDGVETTSFTLNFTRDYYNAQGIITQRIKPAQLGEVTGSFNTREGFSKVMSSITSGTYVALANKQQMDASKSSLYSNNNAIPLRVRLYDPADNTTEIKTVMIDAVQITDIKNSNSVGGDSTFEISFTGINGNLKFSRS